MLEMTPGQYLRSLFILFFIGVGADLALAHWLGRSLLRTCAEFALIGVPLVLLLRLRLKQVNVSSRWALVGLLPAFGFPLALFLYFYPAQEEAPRES